MGKPGKSTMIGDTQPSMLAMPSAFVGRFLDVESELGLAGYDLGNNEASSGAPVGSSSLSELGSPSISLDGVL